MKSSLLIALVVVGCNADKQEHRSQARVEPTGPMRLHMRHCPSAVPSATTSAVPTPNGVDVSITSEDSAARDQILTLTSMMATLQQPFYGMPPHSGMHGGPGTIGHCPIIRARTLITYERISGGVRVHVMAEDRSQVATLQRATAERVRAFATPSS